MTTKAYCTNNGRFTDKGFQYAIRECNRKITYCAVGSHHQNGIVKRKTKELTLILISRTLLLHAIRHWTSHITTMLWPFSLKEAAYCLNNLSLWAKGHSVGTKNLKVPEVLIKK